MPQKIKKILPIFLIFVLALLLRYLSTHPANTIIGYDQARDLFDAKKIISGDIRIVGPTAGNNADLHHGVAFLYFIIPPMILGKGNPFWIVFWNSIFNSLAVATLYFLSLSLFKNKKSALTTSFLSAISYYLISYSAWLSNPTVTLFTVPFSFLGLWIYYKKQNKFGLYLSLFLLGLTIQFELFFVYLIPIYILIWMAFRIKFPKAKVIVFSIFSFCLALSSMIATEIKFKFSGIRSLISSREVQQEIKTKYFKEFIQRYFKTFSETFFPNDLNIGILIAFILLIFILFEIFNKKNKKEKKNPFLFLLIYLLSPFVLYMAGYHKAPWYLIGFPPAILLAAGYVLSKLKNIFLIPVLIFITFINFSFIKKDFQKGQSLLEPDQSAILSKQLEVIKYTYQKSEGEPFSINTVTNPLYINAIWAYNYSWYARNYDYKPTWLGGDQEYPYDILEKPDGSEEIFFLIMDNSGRIPIVHKLEAQKWAEKTGKLIETKNFEGIYVEIYTF
ncbi:hypothetical protein ACFL15_00945 [Patescibacteria group bacterium]